MQVRQQKAKLFFASFYSILWYIVGIVQVDAEQNKHDYGEEQKFYSRMAKRNDANIITPPTNIYFILLFAVPATLAFG